MENNIDNHGQKVAVNATEIITKYRRLEDRINFCLEKNWYHPKETGYDANFFLLVIKGDKRYLPNNFTVNYSIGYYRNGEKLDKKYLIEKMKKNNTYALYTPDTCDPMKFSKAFLMKLIAYIDPNLFREIYSINKKQKAERNYNKWGDFKIDIKNDLIKDIKEFSSISMAKNNRGGFRKTKNHIPTNIFYQFQGRPIQNMNRIGNNNLGMEVNNNLQNQINQLNQANNNYARENQKLKMEVQQLKEQLGKGDKQNLDKDIIMKDILNQNNLNDAGGQDEDMSEIGRSKKSEKDLGNSRAKTFEVKFLKKK